MQISMSSDSVGSKISNTGRKEGGVLVHGDARPERIEWRLG